MAYRNIEGKAWGMRPTEGNVRRVRRFYRLVDYCNRRVYNPAELSIVQALFKLVSSDAQSEGVDSLEQIAREAHVSQASVSRFVRKLGYQSFSDFRNNYTRNLDALTYRLEQRHHRFMEDCGQQEVPTHAYELRHTTCSPPCKRPTGPW